MNYVKIKIICSSKDIIKKAKRQDFSEMDTIFSVDITNKHLYSERIKNACKPRGGGAQMEASSVCLPVGLKASVITDPVKSDRT